jgi:hypothetical protein
MLQRVMGTMADWPTGEENQSVVVQLEVGSGTRFRGGKWVPRFDKKEFAEERASLTGRDGEEEGVGTAVEGKIGFEDIR